MRAGEVNYVTGASTASKTSLANNCGIRNIQLTSDARTFLSVIFSEMIRGCHMDVYTRIMNEKTARPYDATFALQTNVPKTAL